MDFKHYNGSNTFSSKSREQDWIEKVMSWPNPFVSGASDSK